MTVDPPSPRAHRLDVGADEPRHASFSGNVHGGAILKLLDEAAYACAAQHAGACAVTLSVDQVLLREAIHVRELVTFDASVNDTGRTSMEIGSGSPPRRAQGLIRHTNSCYVTMVPMGDDGRPIPVPPWVPVPTPSATGMPPRRRVASCGPRCGVARPRSRPGPGSSSP